MAPLTLAGPTPDERRAVEGLLGRPAGHGASIRFSPTELDHVLREAGVASDLRSALVALTGPVTDREAVRAGEQAGRDALHDALGRGRHAGQGWYDGWIDGLRADGTLTRLIRQGPADALTAAVAVLDLLPVTGETPLVLLAERATGDTKALSGTATAGLVLRALALRAGQPRPRDAGARRSLWESAGVVADDLASQVLVLNVHTGQDHLVASWLRGAAGSGTPFRLTLQHLTAYPVSPSGPDLYVCENPTVLRVAAADLADRCAPLVCTEGRPSAAALRLVAAAARAGVRVHWRGDLDWTGVHTTAVAVERYGACPWRMDVQTYRDALALPGPGPDEPLRGAPTRSPWDGNELARALTAQGTAVMEERLLPVLMTDLERH